MGRRPRASNETVIELFLDMIAAERGASVNTLDAYRRDLADFSADLTNAGETIAAADSGLPSAGLQRRRWRGDSPRSASSIVSSTAKAIAPTIRRR